MNRGFYVMLPLLACGPTQAEKDYRMQEETKRELLKTGLCSDMAVVIYSDSNPTVCPRSDQKGDVVPGSGGFDKVRPTLLCRCTSTR